MRSGNFLIVTVAPFIAIGGSTTCTLDPSLSLASTIGLEISYFSEYIDSIFPESVNNRIKEIEEKDMKAIKEEVKKN